MTTVGSGEYTYELIQDWAHLPPGETFGRISGLAADSQDRVFAFQQKDPPMLIFDREGNLLSSWGNRAFVRAHYIHIANDIAYLTDTDDSVAMVYTLDGKPLQVLGQRGVHSDTGTELYGDLVPYGGGPFNHPTRMVPGPTGDLFVSDGERNCRVHRFTKNGEFIASWGEPGKAGGKFHLPHGLLVDKDGKVYVCDRENAMVQIFTSEGEYITSWTDMCPPTDIAVDNDGVYYVSQLSFNNAHRYDGYPAPVGTGSAVLDSEGRYFTRPGSEAQLSIFDRDGNVLSRWNVRSGHALCLDSRGDIYLSAQHERSIDKYVRQT